MKKQNLLKMMTLLLAAIISLVGGGSVSAWGPERPTYTMKDPAESATFNSITDNAAVGDERDFVKIVEVRDDGVKNPYVNELEVQAGKDYEVYIYYHNDASETYNTKAYDYKGVARNSRLSTTFPDSLKAGERGKVYGAISSTSTTPEKVWDEAYITAKEDVTLHYVASSAKIHNAFAANNSILSRNMFSSEGTFIGLNKLEGTILGCDRFSGHITYKIRAVAVDTPTPPDVDPDPIVPDDPPVDPEPTPDPIEDVVVDVSTPDNLPTAGATEIALLVVLIVLIALCGFWFANTHRIKQAATRGNKSKKTTSKKKK